MVIINLTINAGLSCLFAYLITLQKWYEVSDGGYLIGKNQCLDVMGSQRVTVSKCTGQGGSQQWILQTKPEVSQIN